jgi:hypothetical protein
VSRSPGQVCYKILLHKLGRLSTLQGNGFAFTGLPGGFHATRDSRRRVLLPPL